MSNIENIQRDLDQIKKTYQQKFLHWTDEFVMSNSKERLYVTEKLKEKESKKDIEYSTPPGHAWDFIDKQQVNHKDPVKVNWDDNPVEEEAYFYNELIDQVKGKIEHCNSDVVPKKIKVIAPDKINWDDVAPAVENYVKKPKTIEHNSFCDCPACFVKEQKAVKDQAIVQIEQLDIRPGDRLLITINPRPNGQNHSASSILKINKELANWAGVPVKLIYANVINKITVIRDEDDSDEWCPDRD